MGAHQTKPDRRIPAWALPAIAAVVLAVAAVIYWRWDDLDDLFSAAPEYKTIAGSWVFDRTGAEDLIATLEGPIDPRALAQYQTMMKNAEERYGRRIFTFEPDRYTVDSGQGEVVVTPCTYHGFKPHILQVLSQNAQQLTFSFVDQDQQRVFWNDGVSAIPFRRKE